MENKDKLPWKTTSKMKSWNISATTGLILTNFELRLMGLNQMLWKVKMKMTSHGRGHQNKNYNISATLGLILSKFET